MKTIKIEKFGGPETLEVKDIEIGKPGPKEVLIKNLSIGIQKYLNDIVAYENCS